MIKTCTSKKNVNSSQGHSDCVQDTKLGVELDAFYGYLKPQLDRLKRNPSVETIQRILNYSKSM